MRSALIPLLLWAGALAGCAGDKEGGDAGGVDSAGSGVDDGLVDADDDGYFSDEDCDDNDASVNGGSSEVCDGIDNNCDGQVDEGVTNTYYQDADGDSFGDETASVDSCDAPDGYVANGSDCDDSTAEVSPSSVETCDGLDNDCDGEVDEGTTDTWYADNDADGYGDADVTADACEQPDGYVADATDCDDSTDASYPGNTEVCDEVDNDCDGNVDEGVTATYYADVDEDGFGDADFVEEACSAPTGYTETAGDCDDADGAVNPDADEVCNSLDDDCDGLVDDDDSDVDLTTGSAWYADSDGDGFGDSSVATRSCDAPSGSVADDTDCDDTDEDVNPDGSEVCNGIDDDCDGLTDDDDDSVDTSTMSTWYTDADGDGYGDASTGADACDATADQVADDTDCDDTDAEVSPGATEICNDQDDDCDELVDDDDDDLDTSTATTWYADADGDGLGDPDTSYLTCDAPSGAIADGSDCDDDDDTNGDAYEDDLGTGDTCGAAVDAWDELPDDGATTITIEGRLDAGDTDFYFIDSSQTELSCGTNDYRLHIELVSGEDDYGFIVHRGACDDIACCTAPTDGYTSYDHYFTGDTWASASRACCDDSATADACEDLSVDHTIEVVRTSTSTDGDCATYTIEITNGDWSTTPTEDSDTGSFDTGSGDTGGFDTGSGDTGAGDTGECAATTAD